MTETALALQARNYKGLSGSSQMMTIAALLLTKDTGQKKEKSQIALKQEKTEDFPNENKREP